MKTNFTAVDSRSILQKVLNLPITTWNYKVDSPNVRHIGAMAQDFYQTFKVGADDEHLTSVDTAGVAFAAIQGLNEELKDRDAKIAAQQNQINAQQGQLTQLQQQVKQQQTLIEGMKKLLCGQTPDAEVCRQ